MARRKKKVLENPFVYQCYENPDYFCDRTEETENILSALRNGRNITLISPRKIGKTGLINHAFYYIKEQEFDVICIYIDIFSTNTLQDFVEMISKAVIEDALRREKSFMTKVLDFFKGLRPTITPDLLTGMPTVSVNVVPVQAEYTLKSIFTHLESLNKRVYLAIDEFQQITEYPEKGTEALLRSYIQFVHNVRFIFSGSKKHLMEEMFCSPQRPFYQSTQLMELNPLHEEIYFDFANRFFEAKKGSFTRELFHSLYQRFDGYTWYIQAVMHRLYEQEKHVSTESQLSDAILFQINTMSSYYQTLTTFLTDNQFSLLKAIALERIVSQPQSMDFIQRYSLPNASSVKSALEVLTNKDLVYHTSEGYIIYDRFMGLWLCRI
jgi:AAA+ ATPase superfamily predicted ATPase